MTTENPPRRGGNRSPRRYKGGPPPRRVTIDRDLARQLRHIDPDIKIDNLVHALLVQFLSSLNAPPPASWRGETETAMQAKQTEKVIEHLRHHIGGVEDMGWLSESNDVHALATHMQSYYCNVFPDPHIKWEVVAKWYAQRHDCAADE